MIAEPKPPSLLEDESPRTDHPVEWWFVQGRFQGETTGPREFMVSLFRHSLEWKGLRMGHACTLIASSLDLESGKNAISSIVDPGTTPFVAKAAHYYPPPGLDPFVVASVADELAEYGPPRPIQIAPAKPHWEKGHLGLHWGDFHLGQKANSFHLHFTEPGSSRSCQLHLTPRHRRIHLEKIEVPEGGAMDYVSYTRLDLEGTIDGEAVTGAAWLDHQWGSQGWVVGGSDHEKILGWDWLGVQLDQDCELLIMAHRDMRDRSVLKQYAILIQSDGSSQWHEDLVLTPREWWTAPITKARYPVVWDVQIPSLGMQFRFEPSAVDQEIAMLPPMRAVWEGAGRVTGSWKGKPIGGWARLELHGYAYIVSAGKHIEGIIHNVATHLESYLPRHFTVTDINRLWQGNTVGFAPEAMTSMIAKPLWDMWDRDRSELWYSHAGNLMLAALGMDPTPYEKLTAVTSEALMAGAKILDDIQDKATTRRGEPTIYLRYGMETALLAGGTALLIPANLLNDYPGLTDYQRLELLRILNRCCLRAQMGQAQDLTWSGRLTPEFLDSPDLEQKILQCYQGKDSIFTEAAMEGAAVLAHADAPTRAACRSFGITLGLALGIRNDVGDFSPQNRAAGDAGSDLADGKASFVIARAVARLHGASRRQLISILCQPEARHSPDSFQKGMALIVESGALESSLQTARKLMQEEWIKLSQLVPPSEPKTMLRVLWNLALAPLTTSSGTPFLSASS